MFETTKPQPLPMPVSLAGVDVPAERLALIAAHIEALARTARAVGDTLPLEADVSDMIRALEEGAP